MTAKHINGNHAEYQQLLRNLKTTVEGLLSNQATYVWNIYGGLNRLYSDLQQIFLHGCKKTSTEKKEDGQFWEFIQGLTWLQEDSFSIESECKSNLPTHVNDDKSSVWLYRNLENHSLSQKLSWLFSDEAFVLHYYDENAFLCQKEYAHATIVCLKAVEFNQARLISEIPPQLFITKETSSRKSWRTHRRCVSLPVTQLQSRNLPSLAIFKKTDEFRLQHVMKLSRSKSLPLFTHVLHSSRLNISCTNLSYMSIKEEIDGNSLQTMESQQDGVKVGKHILIDNPVIEHTPPERGNFTFACRSPTKILGASAPEFNLLASIADAEKLPRKTFIEDGGLSVMPMATRYFPKPSKGQSLTSYLISSQHARGNAELDRENAHFNICEAVIAAVEQIKSNKQLNVMDEQESDEEINHLKQKIRIRRRQKLAERQNFNPTECCDIPCRSECSASISDRFTTNSTSSEEDSEEIDILSNLQDNSGLSLSMASLYSESDIAKRPRGVPDGASDVRSAEGVALSLISKFNEKQLPRASDLEWLVSEEDAPQALLPLPKNWQARNEEESSATPLRGTIDWAPPRPQIIFTLHSMPNRAQLMQMQNYRCAGCGMRVAKKYAGKFRYCNYLSRYFCTGCHTNKVAVIPARVLHEWNFKRYTVSTFSYRLIEQMYTDPLFRVFDLNPNIGQHSRKLLICTKFRHGMKLLKEYILTCRFAGSIQDFITSEESYLFNEPDIYSLEDLMNVRTGEMKSKLKSLVEICCRHCTECELCTARGFICEVCKKEEILFPWQIRIVSRCATCGACYHIRCWSKTSAPCRKCSRMKDHNVE